MFVTLALGLAVLGVPPLQRWRIQRQPVADEQQFFLAIHAELRSGASLRHAIAAAAHDQTGRLMDHLGRTARSDEPLDAVVAAMRRLPQLGDRAAVATRVAAETGGRAADVFLRLADRARADTELRLQSRTLTTQARLSAAIVGSLPLLWLALGGVDRLQMLMANGGAIVAVAGVAMEALGVLLVWRLAAA